MLIIGYEYESAYGEKIRKAVICKDELEYRKMKEKIEDAGLDIIEFCEVYKANKVL